MRRLLILLLALTLPVAAQAVPQVSVNGTPLPAGSVVGPAGDDVLVLATPYLQALGARVRKAAGHLEAWFPSAVLTLDAGSDTFTLSGQPGRLQEAVGSMGDDLVVRAREMAALAGGRVSPTAAGLEVTLGAAPAAEAQAPQAMAVAPAAPMPAILHNPGGGATGPALTLGQPQQEKEYQSPYQRPEVGASEAAPAPTASPAPGSKPARAVVADLKARRLMDFHLTSYEITAVIRNEGGAPLTKPFQVQFLARGPGNDRFELLEAFLVRALGPGEGVELKKTVDGHQYHSLQGMEVTFKAQVIDEAPTTGTSKSREGDSREYRAHF